MRKAILGIGVFGTLCWLCPRATDGFFPYPIPSSFPFHPEWEADRLTAEEKKEIDLLCSQPFFYLGKEHQCFVFESKDQSAVLKFPFHSQTLPPFWLRPIPFFAERFHTKKILGKQKKLQTDAMSYLLAFDQLKMETGLLCVHLNRTKHNLPTVVLFDKIGVKQTVALDDFEFVIQKKADPLIATLDRWMANGEVTCAKGGLSALISLFANRYAKGIEDGEYVLEGNYGFIEGVPMQIDVGRLRVCPETVSLAEQEAMIWGVFEPLTAYLKEHHPTLAEHLDAERARYSK